MPAPGESRQASKQGIPMQATNTLSTRLGHEGGPVVLVKITAKVGVIAPTDVVRRIPFALVLVDRMPAVVGVFCRRTAGLVSPPPVRCVGHKPIKMVVEIRPDH